MCQNHGDFEPATLLHTLFSCHTAQGIIRFICENLTYQEDITPTEVIITNSKCKTKFFQKGKNNGNVLQPTG